MAKGAQVGESNCRREANVLGVFREGHVATVPNMKQLIASKSYS